MTKHAVAVIQLLALVPSALLLCLLFKKGSNADTPSLRPEMAAKSISASKAPATAPVVIVFQNTTADKLLLARVESFVPLTIVLTRKCLSADAANEWSLVGMGAQM